MDTVCSLTVYGGEISSAEKTVMEGVSLAENLLGEGNPYLFLAREDGDSLPLGADALKTVSLALRISEITDGAFDVTVAPLSLLWNIKEATEPPVSEEIVRAKDFVGYQQVILDGNTIVFPRAGMGIDLGAVGKGFAADVVCAKLRETGVSEAVLNFGGNVSVLGNKNGDGYQIGIRNPDGGVFGKVAVSDLSVVTSGGYERFFEYHGKKYHHILDPRTGYPSESDLLSATVVASDSMLADMVSTAFFVCGSERSCALFTELCKEYPSLAGAVLLTDSHEVLVLGNLNFSLLDSRYDRINVS